MRTTVLRIQIRIRILLQIRILLFCQWLTRCQQIIFFSKLFCFLLSEGTFTECCRSGQWSVDPDLDPNSESGSRRAGGFSCSLDVLYGGLRISKLQFLIKKITNFFNCKYLVIKTLDPDLYSAQNQCCGSGMFILDPGSKGFPSRIPDLQ
jgi:hypothetical protein